MSEWLEAIPEEHREAAGKFEDPAAMYKSYRELETRQSEIGKTHIRIPGPDAIDSDKEAFYSKLSTAAPHLAPLPDPSDDTATAALWSSLGKPSERSGYSTPKDTTLNDQTVNEALDMAEEAGLTQAQYNKVLENLQRLSDSAGEAMQEMEAQDDNIRKLKWGVAAEQKMAQANALVTQFQDADYPIDSLPAPVLLMLANIAAQFTQDPQAHGQPIDPPKGVMTPDEAAEQYRELMNQLADPSVEMTREVRNRKLAKKTELRRMMNATH